MRLLDSDKTSWLTGLSGRTVIDAAAGVALVAAGINTVRAGGDMNAAVDVLSSGAGLSEAGTQITAAAADIGRVAFDGVLFMIAGYMQRQLHVVSTLPDQG